MKFFALLCVLAISLAGAGHSHASMVTFDDIVTGAGIVAVADGYGGLDWDNFYVLNGALPAYSGSGYAKGVVSGDYVVFNGGGGSTAISSPNGGALFSPTSAVFTTYNATNAYILVSYWLNGAKIKEENPFQIHDYVQTTFNFAQLNVDKVVIDYGSRLTVMDNFTYNVVSTPIPGAILLLGSGVAGLLAFGRRFRSL